MAENAVRNPILRVFMLLLQLLVYGSMNPFLPDDDEA